MAQTYPQTDRPLERLVAHGARKLVLAVHVPHVAGQRELIGRQLAAQVARNSHLVVTLDVLAQAAAVRQPNAADAALDLRLHLADVHASMVLVQPALGLECLRADVADVLGHVHGVHVRGQVEFGEEAEHKSWMS